MITCNVHLGRIIEALEEAVATYPELEPVLARLRSAITIANGRIKENWLEETAGMIPSSVGKGVDTAMIYLQFSQSIEHAAFLATL